VFLGPAIGTIIALTTAFAARASAPIHEPQTVEMDEEEDWSTPI